MNNTFSWVIGVIVINAILIWYEGAEHFQGWRLYLGVAGMILITAISLPLAIMLIIPITGYNLLTNTTRLQHQILGRNEQNNG